MEMEIACTFCGSKLDVVKFADGEGGIRYYFGRVDSVAIAVRAQVPGKAPAIACRACIAAHGSLLSRAEGRP